MEVCKRIKRKQLLEKASNELPHLLSPYRYNKAELCAILDNDCNNIGGFNNERNSCYLDSFLVALFHFEDNNYLVKCILKNNAFVLPDSTLAMAIKRELLRKYSQVVSTKQKTSDYCTNLRQLFQRYDKAYKRAGHYLEPINWTTEQQEPNDVLRFLMRVFVFPDDSVKCIRKIWGANNSKTKVLIRKEHFTTNIADFVIPTEALAKSKEFNLQKYLRAAVNVVKFPKGEFWKADGNIQYQRRIESVKVIGAPSLIIQVPRLYYSDDGDIDRLLTFISAPESIKFKENKKRLYLRSIIIHLGGINAGHYTSVVMCKGNWYYYDDLTYKGRGKMQLIGDFDRLKKWKKGIVFKNCTNLIYA